jgi:hypothetical protein
MRVQIARVLQWGMYPIAILAMVFMTLGEMYSRLVNKIGGPCPKCGCVERFRCGCRPS